MPPRPKAKSLSSLFRAAVGARSKPSPLTTEDTTLKQFVSSIDISSHEFPTKSPKKEVSSSSGSEKTRDDSRRQLSEMLSSILNDGGSPDSPLTNDEKSLGKDIPWFLNLSQNSMSLRRKELSRERKQVWVFKKTQVDRVNRLVKMCAQNIGAEATIEVFGRLGRETGVKEYKALLETCFDKAKMCDNEEASLEHLCRAFQLFKEMIEQGFQIEEGIYGPFFMHLIDKDMVEEFQYLHGVIKNQNPRNSRLGYYEMLLWVRVNNKEKIQELCNGIVVHDGEDKPELAENYALALSETGQKEELLGMLEIIDITKISSVDNVSHIFKHLGRLSLFSYMEKFILSLKACDYEAEKISDFIFDYASNMPNLAVEEVVLKFKDMHVQLVVTPSSTAYEKLLKYCCDSLKVHAALDIVDRMYEAGLSLAIERFHSILHASVEGFEFNLVRRIYSMINRHRLKPNCETYRIMITLHVKMKDFDGAYDLLNDMKKNNLTPAAGIYNAIMGGYFREKNASGASMVLKQMEDANVEPDSQTYCYLLRNCTHEEDIVKSYEKMKSDGVQETKHVFIALLNAYANGGHFKKAKEVLLDKNIPTKSLNEIRSALVLALASHGQFSDALDIYSEVKNSGCNLEPKATISLIEHYPPERGLTELLQLLEGLNDPDYRVDGCCRVLSYCVRYNHLSSAIDLLQQLKDAFHDDDLAMDAVLDEVFCVISETEPVNVKIGMDLLTVVKEELGLCPSRKSLDFLLAACINGRDLDKCSLIWKEYRTAGYCYNVLSYIRMYQAFLACGDHNSAANMLHKIPKDDPHVCRVIQAMQRTYAKASVKGKKKKGSALKEDTMQRTCEKASVKEKKMMMKKKKKKKKKKKLN